MKEEDAMDTGDDTEGGETEVERPSSKTSPSRPSASSFSQNPAQSSSTQASNTSATRAPRPETQSTVFVQRPTEAEMREMRESTPHASRSAAATGAKLTPVAAEAKKRRGGGLGESTGDLSTDSEWEKLSQEG